MGTPEFPDLWKHCSVEDCKLIDFLPFTCDRCSQEVAIEDYFKPIDKNTEIIMNMQLEKEEKQMQEMLKSQGNVRTSHDMERRI